MSFNLAWLANAVALSLESGRASRSRQRALFPQERHLAVRSSQEDHIILAIYATRN
jgi:hypothetical protein